MIVCRDHCYVLSVPDADSSPHGKFASHECAFVNDLTNRILHKPQRCAAGAPSVLRACKMRLLPSSYELRMLGCAFLLQLAP